MVQAAQPQPFARNGAVATSRVHDLDSLARLDVEELGRLYDRAARPTSVDALEGHPRGRMLSVRTLDRGPVSGVLRSIAAGYAFPWGGKSFRGKGEHGEGINRVHLLGRHNLFPFHTHVGPSVLDGAPAILLDYDLPDNPALVRAIHDEVREVDRGLYLGPAMWKTKKGPVLVLWFALDTSIQAVAIGHAR